MPNASRDVEEQLEISAHYSGYLEKQQADIIAFRKDENLLIPKSINYDKLSGRSNEVKSKFRLIKPKTLGQALRIDGITPAAAYILLSYVKRGNIKGFDWWRWTRGYKTHLGREILFVIFKIAE